MDDVFDDDEDELRPEDVPPRRYLATCPDVRPCEERGCRYHLDRAVPYSCALDAAEAGGMKLEEVARHFGLTRERVRQIEAKALPRLVDRLRWSGVETSPAWREALRKVQDMGPAPVAADGDVMRSRASPVTAARTTRPSRVDGGRGPAVRRVAARRRSAAGAPGRPDPDALASSPSAAA